MAEPLDSGRVPPSALGAKTEKDAYEALDELVRSLHERGVLRVLHNATEALPGLSRIAARDLNTDAVQRGTANLFAVLEILGRIPPDRLRVAADAAGDALTRMSHPPDRDEPYPPGLTGAYRLLNDHELWAALGPALEALKAFSAGLQEDSGGERRERERD